MVVSLGYNKSVNIPVKYLPINGIASGKFSSKKIISSLLDFMLLKMSKGKNNVTTKLWSSTFGKAIIMNSLRGQICREFISIANWNKAHYHIIGLFIIIKSVLKEGKLNEHLLIFLGALKHSNIQNTYTVIMNNVIKYIQYSQKRVFKTGMYCRAKAKGSICLLYK